jgi:hypothetical protein
MEAGTCRQHVEDVGVGGLRPDSGGARTGGWSPQYTLWPQHVDGAPWPRCGHSMGHTRPGPHLQVQLWAARSASLTHIRDTSTHSPCRLSSTVTTTSRHARQACAPPVGAAPGSPGAQPGSAAQRSQRWRRPTAAACRRPSPSPAARPHLRQTPPRWWSCPEAARPAAHAARAAVCSGAARAAVCDAGLLAAGGDGEQGQHWPLLWPLQACTLHSPCGCPCHLLPLLLPQPSHACADPPPAAAAEAAELGGGRS